MERSNKISDIFLADELRRLNSHLPKTKKTLKQLLHESTPSVSTIRGEQSAMKKNELEILSTLIPSNDTDRVKLPFVFVRRLDLVLEHMNFLAIRTNITFLLVCLERSMGVSMISKNWTIKKPHSIDLKLLV
jgi:uncharacterized protein (UPF0216 family)